ncbi:TRAP transporter large permease [Roseovarius indicus]|uniref:TRAP transporter large permease n=1 Tax=Roseovarius indicus TaxID=540747 RepID=UPI0032EE9860
MTVMVLMGLTVVALLAFGFPVALVLGATGVFWTWAYDPNYMSGIAHTVFNTASGETLIAIPLFVLMGQIVQQSRVAERFYETVARWLRFLPGGLLHANISVSAVFSAVSGSSMATAATVASAALNSLERLKYDRRMSTGTLAAGGTLGILIPPSIPLIVYGSLAEESIGSLFIAALLPAVLMVSLFHAYIFIRALLNPSLAPRVHGSEMTKVSMAEGLNSVLPVLAIILVVLGGIYAGWTTSTEAAALGSFMSLLAAAWQRAVSLQMLRRVLTETVMLSGMILFIVIGAQVFSFAVYTWGINIEIGRFVADLAFPPLAIFGVIVLVYLVLGMFVDALSLMLMTLAVVHPIVTNLGYDPIWFGIVLVLLLEVGLITPPVGINLFTIKAVRSDIPLSDVAFGALPFVVIVLLTVALLVAFPQIVLWLPFR